MLAKKYINNEKLIISNCDHLIKLDKKKFWNVINDKNIFSNILTYSPKTKNHCFLKCKGKYVSYAYERKKISKIAAAGVYYFQNGKIFLKYTNKVIKKKITFNKMYYISAVLNEIIKANMKISHLKLKKMFPLGSPSEIIKFIKKKKLKLSKFLYILDL